MKTSDFSQIASKYEKTSLVQNSASDELFNLLGIKETDDVLDLGCGTGHLTKRIREITKGNVVGIDSSEGMIEEAARNYENLGISFEMRLAENLGYTEGFDIIFCNSTFQWFNPPGPALENCYRALRKGGKMSIQSPARKVYSQNFIEAIETVRKDYRTGDTFAHFKEPWFFSETPGEYSAVFESVGFEVISSRIDKVTTSYSPDEVFGVFDSGAAAGYLNQAYYKLSLTQEYIENFRSIVRSSFIEQANEDGEVELTFFRIYLIAKKS